MKNHIILFLVFIIMLGILSCTCKDDSCESQDWKYTLEFRGFEDSELTTVILKHYDKGSGFTNARDTTLLTDLEYVVRIHADNHADTLRSISLRGNDSTDYKVEVSVGTPTPAIYAYEISEMSYVLYPCKKCTKTYHFNMLNSYRLNGGLPSSGPIEIRK